ncbi:anillin/rhotekin rtkn [Anaeramoeba flamelloides]|uniref:Anillin/rhotekin rtkn n=1 Tax=Anaeramoeba flamelloides TaxID=1746091 RepID=A0ABQ8X232_9EUKA|nr:anillin/rhotekin rtkn [Anaeramoeba flamelloides]
METSQNKKFALQFSNLNQSQKGIQQNQNLSVQESNFLHIKNNTPKILPTNLPKENVKQNQNQNQNQNQKEKQKEKEKQKNQTTNFTLNRNSNLPFRRNCQLSRAASLDSVTSNNYFNRTGISLFGTERLRLGSFLIQLQQQNQNRPPILSQPLARPKWIPPNFYHSNISSNNNQVSQRNTTNQITRQQQKSIKSETTIDQQTKLFSTINLNKQRQKPITNNPKQNNFEDKKQMAFNQASQQKSEQAINTSLQNEKEKQLNENQKLLQNLNLTQKSKQKQKQKQKPTDKNPNKKNPKTQTKQKQKPKPKSKGRRLVRSRSIEQQFQSTSPILRKRRIERNEQLNKKENEKAPTKKNKINSSIVENGKDLFKLLTGQLWVISGGASQKVLTPFTNQFALKIGKILGAFEKELAIVKSQLKYLLSNSRRTLTEFVLEILVGVLSLAHLDNSPEICNQFWNTLQDIVQLNNNKQQQQQQELQQLNKQQIETNLVHVNNTNENTSEKLKMRLENIYKQIFTEKILMYWFEKRFIDRLDRFVTPKQKKLFFDQHLFYLGKSKFILSCLLLASELVRKDGVTQNYSVLVNMCYDDNPLNLYSNNRGKKVNLIKELISKYGVNNGNYWEIISKDYLNQIKFKPNNIFEFFPFKNIVKNPKIYNLSHTVNVEQPLKKQQFPNKLDETNLKISLDWLKK